MNVATPHMFATMTAAARPVTYPLRRLGLDPGRSLRNARPTPDERSRARAEQLRYIRTRMSVAAATR